VRIGSKSASWSALKRRATELASDVNPGAVYVVDPAAGLQAFASLLAVAMVPDTTLVWAKAADVPFSRQRVAEGLYLCPHAVPPNRERPLYATLTSGSLGVPKLAVGFGDGLELVAINYHFSLYRSVFPDAEVCILASCLPLEYAATFMMVVIPAMFLSIDLVIFPPHRWDLLWGIASREHTACVTVPSLLAAAAVSTMEPIDMSKLALLTTAGYLSRTRIESVQEKFRGLRLLTSYGASETGVMTLDSEPDGLHLHVGRPIAGKAIWIVDADSAGVGKIATMGPDCRESYWGQNVSLRGSDGSVAATDFGHFDKDGNLYLDGRIDGAIKLHGITFYPQDVERHLLGLRGVADVQVRVVTENNIDRLKARVVTALSPAAVQAHCMELPIHLRPSVIECLSESLDHYSPHGKLQT
jgi:acyl-coenzyme A synthetase/AMP-(fatty) acid ligase